MAVLVIGEIEGGDAALDARMIQDLGQPQNAPTRTSLAVFAGPSANGWRVIGVWNTEDDYRTFEREKLQPMFDRLGIGHRHRVEVSPLERVSIAPAAAALAR